MRTETNWRIIQSYARAASEYRKHLLSLDDSPEAKENTQDLYVSYKRKLEMLTWLKCFRDYILLWETFPIMRPFVPGAPFRVRPLSPPHPERIPEPPLWLSMWLPHVSLWASKDRHPPGPGMTLVNFPVIAQTLKNAYPPGTFNGLLTAGALYRYLKSRGRTP